MTKEKADYLWDVVKNCNTFANVLAYELDLEYMDMVHGEDTIKKFLDDWAISFKKERSHG